MDRGIGGSPAPPGTAPPHVGGPGDQEFRFDEGGAQEAEDAKRGEADQSYMRDVEEKIGLLAYKKILVRRQESNFYPFTERSKDEQGIVVGIYIYIYIYIY